MEFNELFRTVAVFALPVVFAVTLHEAAHGYVARHFGDMTAYRSGRISLNPLRHVDLVGTVVLPVVTLIVIKLFGVGVPFGWAKPVPVNYYALRNPKRDMLWVAAAGPAANLLMAFAWALLMRVLKFLPESGPVAFLDLMSIAGMQVNIVLMVLNLLPIPPLDGGRIAMSLLPNRLALGYARLEPFGFPAILVLVLLLPQALMAVMMPMVNASIGLIETIFRL